jgi:exoribonuclease R
MRTIVLQTLESEQASATHEKDSVLIANPSDEREQNEQVQMVTGVIERVWIPIAYRYLQRSNQILYWIIQTQSTQDSLITTERADMAVKAVDDVNNPTEINTVEQDTNSNVCEAIQCSTPSKKSTFSCKICPMVLIVYIKSTERKFL